MSKLTSHYINMDRVNGVTDRFDELGKKIFDLTCAMDIELHLHKREQERLSQRILGLEVIVGVLIGTLCWSLIFPIRWVLPVSITLLLIFVILPWEILVSRWGCWKAWFTVWLIDPVREAWEFYRAEMRPPPGA